MSGRGGDAPAVAEPVGAGPREVLALAVPAFVALVAEPLFLLVDSAVVGHLGTVPLAALGVASAVLLTAVNLFVFLAYGTTGSVARQVGAGSRAGALSAGLAGVWLAAAIGLLVAGVLAVGAGAFVAAFGASGAVTEVARSYLRISAIGVPGMFLVLAATGVLRGLQDTRTPMVVATLGFTGNAVLCVWFVRGLGWGVPGSAWATVLAQWGMAIALLVVVARRAAAAGAGLRPDLGAVVRAFGGGVALLVRTVALRAVLLLTVWVAARFGDVPLAAHQVTATIWSTLTFALDALAIAAQALTGRALGAGDVRATRAATGLMVRWGVWGGVVLGAAVLALAPVLPAAFTPDPAVRSAIAAALVVVAVTQPLSGYVFVIDGVLIGAGDGRWLAVASVVQLLAYLPVVGLVLLVGRSVSGDAWGLSGAAAVTALLWVGFTGFMLVRGLLLRHRVRDDAWAVTGATR